MTIDAGPILTQELLFRPCETQCHAATIAETPKGLVAAWFAGTREGAPDVKVYLSRKPGKRWTKPVEVADGAGVPCWNPVLFQPSKGPLMLFYKVGPDPTRWWGMLRTSEDGGVHWSEARRLPDGVLGPIKNKPIETDDGSILCPTSTESNGWQIHFERTRDEGLSWSLSEPPYDDSIQAIQPSLIALGGQRLTAIGRTRQNRVFRTDSTDGGATWSRLRLIDLPNNNSGTDAIRLRDGRFVFVGNNTVVGPGQWTGPRSPLVMEVSDDAETWHVAATLEDAPNEEFSYPSVLQAKDGTIHVVYTWKRRSIRHATIRPAALGAR